MPCMQVILPCEMLDMLACLSEDIRAILPYRRILLENIEAYRIFKEAVNDFPSVAPLVRSLDIAKFYQQYHQELLSLLSKLHKLEHLAVEGWLFEMFSYSYQRRVGPSFATLKTLHLKGVPWSVAEVAWLISACPKLAALTLTRWNAASHAQPPDAIKQGPVEMHTLRIYPYLFLFPRALSQLLCGPVAIHLRQVEFPLCGCISFESRTAVIELLKLAGRDLNHCSISVGGCKDTEKQALVQKQALTFEHNPYLVSLRVRACSIKRRDRHKCGHPRSIPWILSLIQPMHADLERVFITLQYFVAGNPVSLDWAQLDDVLVRMASSRPNLEIVFEIYRDGSPEAPVNWFLQVGGIFKSVLPKLLSRPTRVAIVCGEYWEEDPIFGGEIMKAVGVHRCSM
ncbi:hypothetical protein BKA93DRAFT_926987 [Sparassis latifolia]|uniref:F-box domain-containing protein n=1 Tax=Sparassis crispa TaxID=139825 RepID=A0A401GAN1_9APHY|nr:hypothetical protein SCP_0204040 [Sparassis crispa]GBE79207.1 hypothetical protein SCP_0204040 [Sparassis crispa]